MSVASSKIIKDLLPDVREALQERTDVDALIPRYLKKAIGEITESNPFEELRRTGPTVTLTANTSRYSVNDFVAPGDDYTSPEAVVIFMDYPNNTVKYTLDFKTPNAIESMTSPATVGPPSRWTRYGMELVLGPVPDKPYSMFMRYQVRHPWPSDNAALLNAPIFIPESWEEIATYAAAQRIAVVKRWNDQAKVCHDILYGDPEFVSSQGKRGRPGIIAARLFQVERDQRFNSRQLGIVQGRYCAR